MSSEATDVLLYVEDNQDHADLVLDTFSRQHVSARVVHVEDGEAAIAYLQQTDAGSAPRPRLILLDLRLPKLDGFEVLRTVKSSPELSDIPVVVLTTSASSQDVSRAYAHHANSYLVKPHDYSTLDGLLQLVSDYWLNRNTLPVQEQ
jgi:CheY-like chemotaxis protein